MRGRHLTETSLSLPQAKLEHRPAYNVWPVKESLVITKYKSIEEHENMSVNIIVDSGQEPSYIRYAWLPCNLGVLLKQFQCSYLWTLHFMDMGFWKSVCACAYTYNIHKLTTHLNYSVIASQVYVVCTRTRACNFYSLKYKYNHKHDTVKNDH